jgi:transcription elongation GreA/GreB family factor
VELTYPGGAEEIFYILGAWDQDEVLSIISSETALAKALMGHKAGDTVEIPAGECELKAILPLSDGVQAWING